MNRHAGLKMASHGECLLIRVGHKSKCDCTRLFFSHFFFNERSFTFPRGGGISSEVTLEMFFF